MEATVPLRRAALSAAGSDLLPLDEGGGDGVVEIRRRLDQAFVGGGSDRGHGRGDRVHPRRLVLLAGKIEGLLLDQIHHPLELVFGPDRELDRDRPGPQPGPDLLDHRLEVGPRPVHLVDERQPGNVEAVGLAPDRLRLRLHPGDPAEDHNRPVEHAQRALDLDCEVHVARGVDQMQLVVPPFEAGGRRGDGDAALALLWHPVHLGLAVVHLPDLVDPSGVEQESLADGGLARIDMRDHADVSRAGELRLLGGSDFGRGGHEGRANYRGKSRS